MRCSAYRTASKLYMTFVLHSMLQVARVDPDLYALVHRWGLACMALLAGRNLAQRAASARVLWAWRLDVRMGSLLGGMRCLYGIWALAGSPVTRWAFHGGCNMATPRDLATVSLDLKNAHTTLCVDPLSMPRTNGGPPNGCDR